MLQRKKEYQQVACVYVIICEDNGMRYVGQTRNLYRRVGEHSDSLRRGRHRNRHLQEDYNKYGELAFDLEIISTNSENLDQIESDTIAHYRELGLCYNVFSGGLVGYKGNDEFRKKISVAHKGRVVSQRTRQLNAEAARRQWEGADYRETMVSSARRQWDNPEYREMMRRLHTGNANACGHKLTEDIVRQARLRHSAGEKVSALAAEYGVTYCTMSSAINGTSWKFVK